MKRVLGGAAVILLLSVPVSRLWTRWREEAADRNVTLLVDWAEVRDAAARQNLTDNQLLERLHDAGANALLVGASTVEDYLEQQSDVSPSRLTFSNRIIAEAVRRQLQERLMSGVTFKANMGKFELELPGGQWERLKDAEVGFNPELLGKAKQAGFILVLRINHDPWLTKENLFSSLQEIGAANQDLGFLLNTDEVPGGTVSLPQWASFLESQNYNQLLFEFHPAKSALKLGVRSPRSTYRAHTIAPNELKDLTPDQQQSRWRRAVQERSCRFLLVHVSPLDTLSTYLDGVAILRQDLMQKGWKISWPKPKITWTAPSFIQRQLAPILALLLAILFPVLALQSSLKENPWRAYIQIIFLTLAGASIMAGVAQNPWTRIEVVPFKGIKMAVALAWLGSACVLYPWKEMKTELSHAVRRIDIVAGLGFAAVLGYLFIRSGNASAGWKVGWEQGLRDRLEDLLVARPRFKEFAIGYPLLFLGLHMKSAGKPKMIWRDGRFWIALGMIGPISMVNTFCHLHSPLYLAYWRSLNGAILGTLVGTVFLWAWKKYDRPIKA